MIVAIPAAAAEEVRDLSALIEPLREKFAAPGTVAAVIRDGKIVGLGAAGVRKLGTDARVDRGDLVMIGSCGKSATRLLIGRLVDQRRLRFESTLGELLADVKMRDEYKNVTIAQVLAHRGGIAPYTEVGPARTPELFDLKGSPTEQRAHFTAQLLNKEPAATPGARFVYSNAGYGLLGHIAERLAGKAYEELIADEVFRPLGMTTARVGNPAADTGHGALWGHMRSGDEYRAMPTIRAPLPPIAPAGMMSCSIEDFARLAGQLARIEAGKPGDFVSGQTAAKLVEARPGERGDEGVPFFGGDGLYTAAFAVWPSQDLAIVVGTNAGSNDGICAALLEAIRAELAPTAKRIAAIGPPSGRPRLGITIKAIETNDEEDVWEIGEVLAGSPAEKAGLRAGDRFVKINGAPVKDLTVEERRQRLAAAKVTLTMQRDGHEVTAVIEIP